MFYLIPKNKHKYNRLKLIIEGPGKNLFEYTHIEQGVETIDLIGDDKLHIDEFIKFNLLNQIDLISN